MGLALPWKNKGRLLAPVPFPALNPHTFTSPPYALFHLPFHLSSHQIRPVLLTYLPFTTRFLGATSPYESLGEFYMLVTLKGKTCT